MPPFSYAAAVAAPKQIKVVPQQIPQQDPSSYAAIMASQLRASEGSEQSTSPSRGLQKLGLKGTSGTPTRKNQGSTTSESAASTTIETSRTPSPEKADNASRFNATIESPEKANDSARSSAPIESPEKVNDGPRYIAPAESPARLPESSEHDEIHISPTSQTSSNSTTVPSEKTISKPTRVYTNNTLSWDLLTTAQRSAKAFHPLANLGSANFRPLSPPHVRPSRFFPATESLLDSKNGGVKYEDFPPTTSAFAHELASPATPFFTNGLCGGLTPGSKDLNYQRQLLARNIDSYVTQQYASIPGSVPNVYDYQATAAQKDNQSSGSNSYFSKLQVNKTRLPAVGHAAGPGAAEQFYRDLHAMSQEEIENDDGGASLTEQLQEPASNNSRAGRFVPRYTTTLAELEQTASAMNVQRTLSVTRPRNTWDEIGNWRTQRGQTRPSDMFHDTDTYPGDRVPSMSGAVSRYPDQGYDQAHFPMPLRSYVPSNIRLPSQTYTDWAYDTESSTQDAIASQGTQSPAFKPFRPMNAVLNQDVPRQPLSPEDIAFREANGISMNYEGNHENPRNISADIEENENCAVWITQLPERCTHRDLITALARCRPGRIWACHINPPVLATHTHAAAKVVFYHPAEAQRLIQYSARGRGIELGGRRIRVIHNKQRVAAQTYPYHTSRCLEIAGAASIVSERFLRTLFAYHFQWDDEAVTVLGESRCRGMRAVEWRFGSMRAQAEAAYKLILSQYPNMFVAYVSDPCAFYANPTREEVREMDEAAARYQVANGARADGGRAVSWGSTRGANRGARGGEEEEGSGQRAASLGASGGSRGLPWSD